MSKKNQFLKICVSCNEIECVTVNNKHKGATNMHYCDECDNYLCDECYSDSTTCDVCGLENRNIEFLEDTADCIGKYSNQCEITKKLEKELRETKNELEDIKNVAHFQTKMFLHDCNFRALELIYELNRELEVKRYFKNNIRDEIMKSEKKLNDE